MPTPRPGPTRVAVLAAALALAGCSRNSGPSDFDKMTEAKQGTSASLTASGAKFKLIRYPLGEAYAVDLSGLTVTDDLLRQVKQLGNVSELDLSKSTVTDDQLGLIQELGLTVFLVKLDLGGTAVTDAGLDKLSNFVFLSQLTLTNTKVTRAAVDRFKQKRNADPKARVKNTTVKM